MKINFKKLIISLALFLLFGCGDSDFKSQIKFITPSPYILGVNGTFDYIHIRSGDSGYSTNPHDYSHFWGEIGKKQDISYEGIEEIKLEENKNHIYYATNCIESGHIEHTVRTNEVNVVNLSDLDISIGSHTLELSYGDKNLTISNNIQPCSITPILSLKDFKYSSSNLEVRMDDIHGYSMHGSHYLTDAQDRLVSLDIIIFEDYTLGLIAIFSYELDNKIAKYEYEQELIYERENYDEDEDNHDWDWD